MADSCKYTRGTQTYTLVWVMCVCVIVCSLQTGANGAPGRGRAAERKADRRTARRQQACEQWKLGPCVPAAPTSTTPTTSEGGGGGCGAQGHQVATRPRRCGSPTQETRDCVVTCDAGGALQPAGGGAAGAGGHTIEENAETTGETERRRGGKGKRRGRGRGEGRKNKRNNARRRNEGRDEGEHRLNNNRQKKQKRKNRKNCDYVKGDWSSCDTDSNTQSRLLSLNANSPTHCPANKTITRPCQQLTPECRYRKVNATQCTEGERQLTMTLTEDSPADCTPSKVITRPCGAGKKQGNRPKRGRRMGINRKRDQKERRRDKKRNGKNNRKQRRNKCMYTVGEWESTCVNGTRSKVKYLIPSNQTDSNPERDDVTEGERSRSRGRSRSCEPEEVITKPCLNKAGEERCFFGGWGDYGPCQNGVKTKTRHVVAGGDRCARQAVKTRAC